MSSVMMSASMCMCSSKVVKFFFVVRIIHCNIMMLRDTLQVKRLVPEACTNR